MNPDQPLSVCGVMSAAAFDVSAFFPASVEVEWVWGFDLHTKLFLPPLCSSIECGKNNCLHQSEVFNLVGSVQIRRDVGRRQELQNGKLLCGISAEDAHIVLSDHCRETLC